MKVFKKLFTIITCSLFLLTSCNDFLDLAPESQMNSNNFYRTAEDMNNALTAVYGSLQYGGQYYSSLHAIGELRSDNTWISNPNAGADLQAVDQFLNNAGNSVLNTAWNAHYQGIQAANIVIDKIEDVTMDGQLKSRYLGEAKFLRSLMYFNLVRIFGDVPLVLTMINNPDDGYVYARAPIADVYAQIVADLEQAVQSLPYGYDNANVGRATKGAAMSLLGKVYLTQKQWDLAAQQLKAVIDESAMNGYRLLDNYSDIFGATHENNEESIFEVQFRGGASGEGSPFTNQFAPIGSGNAVVSVGNPLGQNIPTDDMDAAYEAGDVRKESSMANSYVLNDNTVQYNYIVKYRGVPAANLDSDNNWIVLRFADVVLMYAEALNELGFVADGEAFTYLNQIRERANLEPKTSNHATAALRIPDQGAFRLAVEQERRIELAFEGHRWFDLVRTDRALPVLTGLGMAPHHVVFPIPQSQVDINPDIIIQNEGYTN